MKPYSELTERGKVRRLHGLVHRVLGRYDLQVARLRCIARDTNSTFRVDTTDSRTYALRIGTRPEDTEVDTPTEVAWLDALSQREDIESVRVVPTRSGDRMVRIQHDGVDGPRTCVLFSWLRGRPIGDDAGPDEYRRLGDLAARLHDHGEKWQMPSGLRPLVWDRVFYYPTEPVVLYDQRFEHLLTPARATVVRQVEEKAATELERLHREVPVSVLHGDLHPWNVHRWRDRIAVFDFEDVMVGAPVQDIATTLFYNRDHPAYPALCEAFREGYTALRRWPVEWEGQLELLMAARTVMFINYVLRLDYDPYDHIPRMTERIERVL